MCRWQLIAYTDECRCSQQRIHWLYGISASLVMFKDYLKKIAWCTERHYEKEIYDFQYNIVACTIIAVTSDIIGLLFIFYLYISHIFHCTWCFPCEWQPELHKFKKKITVTPFIVAGKLWHKNNSVVARTVNMFEKPCPMQPRTAVLLHISLTTYHFVLQYNLEINQTCVPCFQRVFYSESKPWNVWKYGQYIPEGL